MYQNEFPMLNFSRRTLILGWFFPPDSKKVLKIAIFCGFRHIGGFEWVFICFMIWINFHHKTGRVGRRPTEPLFFSFMAGWEKEGGQWFQHALVGYLLIPFYWNAFPTIFTFYTCSSSDQNSRDVPWGRWQLHGLQEEGSWREDVLKV